MNSKINEQTKATDLYIEYLMDNCITIMEDIENGLTI